MIRVCLEPSCPNPAEVRGRCREHAAQARKANRSPNDNFYASKAWRLTRRRQLFGHPFCQYQEDGQQCCELADSVHHIQPIEEGGARRDPANLLSVCRRHHSIIHAQRKAGVTAWPWAVSASLETRSAAR